jgi:hypothetical protein
MAAVSGSEISEKERVKEMSTRTQEKDEGEEENE